MMSGCVSSYCVYDEITRYRGGAIATQKLDSTIQTVNQLPDNGIEITTTDGETVHLHIEATADGRRLILTGINVELDGDAPGSYYLL